MKFPLFVPIFVCLWWPAGVGTGAACRPPGPRLPRPRCPGSGRGRVQPAAMNRKRLQQLTDSLVRSAKHCESGGRSPRHCGSGGRSAKHCGPGGTQVSRARPAGAASAGRWAAAGRLLRSFSVLIPWPCSPPTPRGGTSRCPLRNSGFRVEGCGGIGALVNTWGCPDPVASLCLPCILASWGSEICSLVFQLVS